ncbi:MAG: ComEC/Rec2 family competence protein, partial [Desulfomonilaceae bacterium]
MLKIEEFLGEWVAARPAFFALIGLVIGILLGEQRSDTSNYQILMGLLSSLMVMAGAFIFRRLILTWLCVLLAFALIGFSATVDSSRTGCSRFTCPKKQVVQATVVRVLGSNYGHRILLLKSGYLDQAHEYLSGYGRLNLRENHTPVLSGDRISFRSSIRVPVNRGNPGEYDWETDCRNEGIGWLVNTRGPDAIVVLKAGSTYSPSAILSRLRSSMSDFIETHAGKFFGSNDANAIKAIHKGIILGDRAEISGELNKAFSNSGLIHMLSASGSHVTIVAVMTFFLVKTLIRMAPNIMLWAPLPKIAGIFCIPAISVYCLLVGLKPPAMRAGIVGIALAVSMIFERRWDSLNSLAVSAIIILLFYPLSIFTPSFQLSFAAVAGILLIVQSPLFHSESAWVAGQQNNADKKSTSRWTKILASLDLIKRPVISLVVSSLAATVAITPLLIHLFHSVPIYSIPANLISDFALTMGLSIGLGTSLIGALSPVIGGYLICPADLCIWFVIKIALLTDSLPHSTLKVPNLGSLGLILAIATTIVTFYYIVRPGKRSAVIIVSSWIAFVSAL